MKYKTLHIAFLFCLLTALGWSQNPNIKDSLPTVKLLSRVQENKILLRWAIDDALAWQKMNANGFVLEKYLFSINGERLPQPKQLWSKAIKADS